MLVLKGIYYDFWDFRLDVEKQLLLKSGEPVSLTHKAFQILLLLVQNSGHTTKKEDIFALLWADSFVEDANLTQHIYVLRKTLGQMPDGNNFIETVPKQGYRFTVPVKQVAVAEDEFENFPQNDLPRIIEDENQSALKISINGSSGFQNLIQENFPKNGSRYEKEKHSSNQSSTPAVARLNSFSLRWRLIFFILLITVGAASVAGIYYWGQEPPVVSSAFKLKSIAVLPFRAIGEEVDKEKLGLGMADAVVMRLSKLKQIEVRPTSAVFRYTDNPPADSVVAGRELGVDAVLEGTVQCDGERVRVSIQLIRTADGKPLWADSFQEKVFDVFAVQDSISVKVATALAPNLTAQQERVLVQRTTNNAEAFQSYQLGIYFWNKRGKEDLWKAVGYFQRAIELDSGYAQAYAMLADTYNMLGFYNFADVGEMKTKAREAAEKSLALDDSSGDAYVGLAMMHVLEPADYEQARQFLERAIALVPHNASARLRYGWLLLVKQNLEESVLQFRLAQEYDPLSPATNKGLCNVLTLHRQFDEAIKYCEKSREISAETPGVRVSLANAYFVAGKYQDAVAQILQEIETNGETVLLNSLLTVYYAKMGRRIEAEKLYGKLQRITEKNPSNFYELTLAAYALGRRDEAFAYFKESLKNPFPELSATLNYDPNWDDVRADSQFAALFPN